MKCYSHVVYVGLLQTPLSHSTGDSVLLFSMYLYCIKTPILEAVAFRSCSNVYRQQTYLSNLQIKCKTANDRWWGQTGKSKKQTSSTTRVLDGGHSTADSAHSLWAAMVGRKARESSKRLFVLCFSAEVQSKTNALSEN